MTGCAINRSKKSRWLPQARVPRKNSSASLPTGPRLFSTQLPCKVWVLYSNKHGGRGKNMFVVPEIAQGLNIRCKTILPQPPIVFGGWYLFHYYCKIRLFKNINIVFLSSFVTNLKLFKIPNWFQYHLQYGYCFTVIMYEIIYCEPVCI